MEYKSIDGFDSATGVAIVDQGKSIDMAYKSSMQRASLFFDPLHIRKNMTPHLGSNKATALEVYHRAVYQTTTGKVDAINTSYTKVQAKYLSKFSKDVIYRAYYQLEDITTTSQGSDSRMEASIRNNIRSVEPQKMVLNMLETQSRSFLRVNEATMSCTKTVPPTSSNSWVH